MQVLRQTLVSVDDRLLYLATVVERIAAARDFPSLMAIVRTAARHLTAADGATLVLRDNGKCFYADEDAIGPLWKGQRFPLEACISGWAMLHAEAVAIEDIYADDRIPHDAYRPTFVKSLSMVPVGVEPIGAIGCYWARRHQPTDEEVRLQKALASATAVGIANLDLYRHLENAREEAERRAAEAQENERRFRATFEQAAVGLAHVSPDGRWLRVNTKLCDIVGYSREELLERTFQDITHPDDLVLDLAVVPKMLSGELQTTTFEKRYIHRLGHHVWINLTVSLVHDSAGAPDYFIAVIEDIRARKEAELALEEERAIFRNLTDIASDYFWELDEFFRFKDISPAIADRSGLNYHSYIGKTRWELPVIGVSEDGWRRHRATLEAHLPFRNFEISLANLSGEIRTFLVSGDPVFAKDGTFKGYRGVTQDVTERQHALARLRQQATIFANTQEGIVIADLAARVVDANPAFERITEYALDEIRGQNLRFLQSGRHDRAFYLNMWRSINELGYWQGEIWNRRKSGEIFLEWISISAVHDDNGKVTGYIGSSVDVDRMAHAKSRLERLAHHDALTDLPNRLLLLSRLEHSVERARRDASLGAVLFLDLDRFKQVNDTLGHKAGDELLVAVAGRLRARVRDVDTVARLGGDEFVIVLDGISTADDARAVAGEVIAALHTPFPLSGNTEARIGASVGIALFPQDSDDAAHLVECADQALYAAKAAGRGICRFYAP